MPRDLNEVLRKELDQVLRRRSDGTREFNKDAKEQFALDRVLDNIEGLIDAPRSDLRRGVADKSEPDFVWSYQNNSIGIEVTQIAYGRLAKINAAIDRNRYLNDIEIEEKITYNKKILERKCVESAQTELTALGMLLGLGVSRKMQRANIKFDSLLLVDLMQDAIARKSGKNYTTQPNWLIIFCDGEPLLNDSIIRESIDCLELVPLTFTRIFFVDDLIGPRVGSGVYEVC